MTKKINQLPLVILAPLLLSCVSALDGSYKIFSIETGLIIPEKDAYLVKAECLIEMNKIPIPSSSYSASDCSNLVGFSAGLCSSGNQIRASEARRIVEDAQEQRKTVYDACLLVRGYRESWVVEQTPQQ